VNFKVEGKPVFAYTADHELDPGKPTLVFVHGAGLDHSVFALQSRYFGYHGWNVLALDLPGHGRSAGPRFRASKQWQTGFSRFSSTSKFKSQA